MSRPADPYREPDEAPISIFEIRSSAFFIVGGVFACLCGVVLVWVGFSMLRLGPVSGSSRGLLTLLALAGGPAIPIALWSSRAAYLVRGGKGRIELFSDRLEISDAAGRHVVAGAQLQSLETRHRVRVWIGIIPLGTAETDRILELRTPGRRVVLSRRLFADPADYDRFTCDIDRLARGVIDQPETPPPPAAPTPDDEYRRRLAYELDHLEDDDDD